MGQSITIYNMDSSQELIISSLTTSSIERTFKRMEMGNNLIKV